MQFRMEAAASGDKVWNCTDSWQHLSCLPGPSSVDDPFEMAVERPRPQPLGMSPRPRRPGSEGQESRPAEAAKVGKGPASGLPAPKKAKRSGGCRWCNTGVPGGHWMGYF